jgi:hypothetical protein
MLVRTLRGVSSARGRDLIRPRPVFAVTVTLAPIALVALAAIATAVAQSLGVSRL